MTVGQWFLAERRHIERVMRAFFHTEHYAARRAGILTEAAFSALRKTTLIGTHKRMRPLLVLLGYRLFGGHHIALARRASLSVELLHRGLLIHDDVIDRDALRHGQPTVHELFRSRFRPRFGPVAAEHLGASLAILIGDLALTSAFTVINDLSIARDRRSRMTAELLSALRSTIFGQTAELGILKDRRVTIRSVQRINALKTAQYSFEAPLAIGAILAGAPQKSLPALASFSRPVGEAFQLRDDTIDLFGSTKTIGKPVGSDLREGKRTILILETLRRLPVVRRRELKRLLERQQVTARIIARVRHLVRDSGALTAVERRIARLIPRGIAALRRFPSKDRLAQEALITLAKHQQGRVY